MNIFVLHQIINDGWGINKYGNAVIEDNILKISAKYV